MRSLLVKFSGLLLLLLTLLNPVYVFGAEMTNNDVIQLVKAGMSEDLIISLIAKSETTFDTSTKSIIALSKAGVSQKIISAMINPVKADTKSGQKEKDQSDANRLNPEEIIFLDDGQEKTMSYVMPEIRTGARAFGFGGVSSQSVLRGDQAQLRTTNKTPSFLASVPKNIQPSSYITLTSLDIRKNESREVVVGGGFMSYSSGIQPDRIMPMIFEKMGDQARAAKDFVLYKMTSQNALTPGEYALFVYTKEVRSTGFLGGLFGQGANPCFDFGVD